MNNNEKVWVNYGCGLTAPIEWVNYDASPTLQFERIPLIGGLYTKNDKRFPSNVLYGDISRGLRLDDNSVDLVYCSHILEHLSYQCLQLALSNTYKIMKSGAIFRLVVPDLEAITKRYLESSADAAAVKFMQETLLGCERRDSGMLARLKTLWSNSQHLWMWDYKSLKLELEKKEFKSIRRADYGDSSDKNYSLVENRNRFVDSICIECQK